MMSFRNRPLAGLFHTSLDSDTKVYVNIEPLSPDEVNMQQGVGSDERDRGSWTKRVLNQHSARIIAQIYEYIYSTRCVWAIVYNS